MIALFKPLPETPEPQRAIKRILQNMTGLGVRLMSMQAGNETAAVYLFKCQHAKARDEDGHDAEIRSRILEMHTFHNYIKKLLVIDTGATYDQLAVDMCEDPDDPDNEIWPCVRVRFSNLRGVPHSDEQALEIAKKLENRLKDHVLQTSKGHLQGYRQTVKGQATFRDFYANELT